MGEVINVRTRKNEKPPQKIPTVALLIIGVVIAGIIAGLVYLMR